MLLVAIGGLVGCVARYWLAGIVQRLGDHGFPMGTLAVNVLGSLVIGLVMTLSLERGLVDEDIRILLTTGFAGSDDVDVQLRDARPSSRRRAAPRFRKRRNHFRGMPGCHVDRQRPGAITVRTP
jgi:hypothetical protein